VNLDHLSPEERDEAERLLAELDQKIESNPLYKFRNDNEQQLAFLGADTRVRAAFCGNRFGKTTALIVKALIECLDPEYLPEWMLPYKKWYPNENTVYPGTKGRLLCPTFQVLETVVIPELRRWVPQQALKNGKWGRGSWNQQVGLLQFENGSFLEFRTYQQDVSHMAGASLHFVGYDEPPPWEHRRECRVRLTDYDGYELFAMTPLKANTGWVRRTIYKNREHPDVTVIRGSIHDNKLLSPEAIQATLDAQPDAWKRAVEYGDFVDIGGLVYPDFERCVVASPTKNASGWTPYFTNQTGAMGGKTAGWDIVVGIDPGIRNFAAVWCGFDSENRMYVFDEMLLQEQNASDAAKAIKRINKKWGIREALYVIDPASRQRAQVNSETVQSELLRQGIPTMTGQNDVEAGCLQIRQRIDQEMLFVNPECKGLRDEADDYALEDREDGVFKPMKGNDHRLDALRYVGMARAWAPLQEVEDRQLGSNRRPDVYDPHLEDLLMETEYGPMGAWS
jgi:hypothetical protein